VAIALQRRPVQQHQCWMEVADDPNQVAAFCGHEPQLHTAPWGIPTNTLTTPSSWVVEEEKL